MLVEGDPGEQSHTQNQSHIDGFVHDCVLANELAQSYYKLTICCGDALEADEI